MVVLLEDTAESELVSETAVLLARGCGATLTGLVPPTGDADRLHASRAHFARTADGEGLEVKVRQATDEVSTLLSHGQPIADLVCMARGEYRDAPLGSAAEAMVRSTRLPCLLTSRSLSKVQRIAVAYDGSPGAVRALAAAAELAVRWPVTPEILLVAVVPRGGQRARPLTAAARYLRSYGLHARRAIRAGAACVEVPEVVEQAHVDLLCLGAFGHTTLHTRIFGSTTRLLIEQRPGSTLLFS